MTAETVSAPKWPMVATCAAALLAVVAAVACWRLDLSTTETYILAATGYVLGCIGAVATASVHRALENKEKSNPNFQYEPWIGTFARVAMVVGIVGGLACAFFVARELAKL